MKIAAKILLWIVSLGALATALILIFIGVMFQLDESANFARANYLVFSAVTIFGAGAALLFSTASNPFVSQKVPLRSSGSRWVAASIAIVAGGAALAGMNFTYRSATSEAFKQEEEVRRIAEEVLRKEELRLLAEAWIADFHEDVWSGKRSLQSAFGVTSPLLREPRLVDRADQLMLSMFGANESVACLPVRAISDDSLLNLEGMADLVEAVSSSEDLNVRIAFAEAFASCIGTISEIDPTQSVNYLSILVEEDVPLAKVQLGIRYWDGVGAPEDRKKAVDLFKQAAADGMPIAKAYLARAHHVGDGVPQSAVRSRVLFREAADDGVNDARIPLAYLLALGEGGDKNSDAAIQQFREFCLNTAANECQTQAELLDPEFESDLPNKLKDYVLARAVYEMSCKSGVDRGCIFLADFLRRGLGGPKDLIAARKTFLSYCETDNPDAYSCRQAAFMLFGGEGGEIDHPLALEHSEIGCQLDDPTSCYFAGVFYRDGSESINRNEAKSQTFLARACDLGKQEAC